jgi:hypothetical protein
MKQNGIKKIVIGSVLVVIAFIFSKIKLYKFLFPLGHFLWIYNTIFNIDNNIIWIFLWIKIWNYFMFSILIIKIHICWKYLSSFTRHNWLSYVVFFISGFSLFRKNVNSLSSDFILSCILRWLFTCLPGCIC